MSSSNPNPRFFSSAKQNQTYYSWFTLSPRHCLPPRGSVVQWALCSQAGTAQKLSSAISTGCGHLGKSLNLSNLGSLSIRITILMALPTSQIIVRIKIN